MRKYEARKLPHGKEDNENKIGKQKGFAFSEEEEKEKYLFIFMQNF